LFNTTTYLVNGKGGNDPRRRRMRQQKFSGEHTQLVSGGYANEFPQETCVRRFLTPFPTLY